MAEDIGFAVRKVGGIFAGPLGIGQMGFDCIDILRSGSGVFAIDPRIDP